jgi:hypothetical protein
MKFTNIQENRFYFSCILLLLFLAVIFLKPEENNVFRFSNNIYIQKDTSFVKLKNGYWDKEKNSIFSNHGIVAKTINTDAKTLSEFDLLEYELNDPNNTNSLLIKNANYSNSGNFYWEMSLYLFFILFIVYGIKYFPSDYRFLRDMRRNYNLVPFSYLNETERYQKIKDRLYCKICNTKIPQNIVKEEFVQGMQFVTLECNSCKNQVKERLL